MHSTLCKLNYPCFGNWCALHQKFELQDSRAVLLLTLHQRSIHYEKHSFTTKAGAAFTTKAGAWPRRKQGGMGAATRDTPMWSTKARMMKLNCSEQFYSNDNHARNQLGTPGGAKSFLRGAQIFWTMSNMFKLYPTHFSRGAKHFLEGASPSAPPLVAGLTTTDNCKFGS